MQIAAEQKALSAGISAGVLVLDTGSGTGQRGNFLGMSWKRKVSAGYICMMAAALGRTTRSSSPTRRAPR